MEASQAWPGYSRQKAHHKEQLLWPTHVPILRTPPVPTRYEYVFEN